MLNNLFNFQNPNNKIQVEEIRVPSTVEKDTAEFQTIQGKKQVVQSANTQVAIVKTANSFFQYDGVIEIPAGANPNNFWEYKDSITSPIICNQVTFLFNSVDVPDEQYAIFSFNGASEYYDSSRGIWRYRGMMLGNSENNIRFDFTPHKPQIFITPYSPNTFPQATVIPYSIIFANVPR